MNLTDSPVIPKPTSKRSPAEPPITRTNYIFVDYENVQDTDLDRIAGKPVMVALILGERNKTLPVGLVKLIQKHPEQVRLVETELNGKNALDFVLACEIGIESQKDRHGYFHVLSKDKGFDAMIRHLRGKGILASRHATFGEIPLLMNLGERVAMLGSQLKAHQANRPKKRKTLESQIQASCGKMLSSKEVEDTIHGLIGEKIITLSEDGKVCYSGHA